MACDLMYRIKKEEGLRIIECISLNEAIVAKYVWNLAPLKRQTIYGSNRQIMYTSKKKYWSYEVPQATSCCWKKIRHSRDKYAVGYIQNGWLKSDYKYTISSGYK